MKVLLTGATGFIGSHLLALLSERGHQVIALRRTSSHIGEHLKLLSGVSWHNIDDHLPALFKKQRFDSVIHLAVNYGRGEQDLASLIESNIVFPLNLLQHACNTGCRKFLHTDTFYSIKTHQYDYLKEYILSKQQLADWCLLFSQRNPATSFYNVRLEHVYGPLDNKAKFIPSLITKMLANVPEIDLTRATQKRDFVYVTDVAKAYIALLEWEKPLPGYTQLGVGTGKSIPMKEMIVEARALTYSTSRLNFDTIPMRKGEIMDSTADTAILNQLNWKAEVSLTEGLTKTIASLQTNAVRDV